MANITGKKRGNIITLEGLDYGKKYSVVMTPTTSNIDGLGINEGESSETSFYSGVENKVIDGSLEKKNNYIHFTRFDSVLGADEYQVEFLELIDNLPYVREVKRFDSDFFSEKYELEKLGTYYSARVFPMFRDKLWNQCWGHGISSGSTLEIKPLELDITALNTLEDDRTLSVAWAYYDEVYNNFKNATLELFSHTGVPITDKYTLSNLRGLYQDLTLSNAYDVFDNYPYMTLKIVIECQSGVTLEKTYKVTDGIEKAWITDITTNSMKVHWDAVHGAHYYSVKIDKGGSVIETRTTADSSVFYHAQNLDSGTEYGFQILALDKYKRPLNNNNNYSPRAWAYTKLPNVINYSFKTNDSLSSIEVSHIISEGQYDPGIRYEVQVRTVASKTAGGYTYDNIFFEKETVTKPNSSVAEDGGVQFSGIPRGVYYEIGVRSLKNQLVGDFKTQYVKINVLDIKSAYVANGGNYLRYGYEIMEGDNADNYTHMPVAFDPTKIVFNNFGNIKTGNLLNMPNKVESLTVSSRVYYKLYVYSGHTDHPSNESKVYPSYIYTKKFYGDISRFYTTLDTSVTGNLASNKIYTMFGCNYYFRIYLVIETPGMADIVSKEYIKGTIVFPMYHSSTLNSLKSKTYIGYRQTDSYKNHRARHVFATLMWGGDEVHFIRSMMCAFKQGYDDKSYQYTYYSFNKYNNSFVRTQFKSKAINAGSGSGSFDCKYYNDCDHGIWQAGAYEYYSVSQRKFGLATKTMGGSHHDDYGWDQYRAGWIYFYGKNGTWSAIYKGNLTSGGYSITRSRHKQS